MDEDELLPYTPIQRAMQEEGYPWEQDNTRELNLRLDVDWLEEGGDE